MTKKINLPKPKRTRCSVHGCSSFRQSGHGLCSRHVQQRREQRQQQGGGEAA